MVKAYIKSAVAGVFLLGFATAAIAGEFDNQCSWGLANSKHVKTDCSVNAAIKGKTYCFSSEQAKTDFMKDPGANLAKAATFYGEKHG